MARTRQTRPIIETSLSTKTELTLTEDIENPIEDNVEKTVITEEVLEFPYYISESLIKMFRLFRYYLCILLSPVVYIYLEIREKYNFCKRFWKTLMTVQEELDELVKIKGTLDQAQADNQVLRDKISHIAINFGQFVSKVSELLATIAQLQSGMEVSPDVVAKLAEIDAELVQHEAELQAISVSLDPLVATHPEGTSTTA